MLLYIQKLFIFSGKEGPMKKKGTGLLVLLAFLSVMLPGTGHAANLITVSSVDIKYDVANFLLYTSSTEGEVSQRIKSMTNEFTKGVRKNTTNTGLEYRMDITTYSGIGDGSNLVNAIRQYYICLHLQLESGYTWPDQIPRKATSKTYIPISELTDFRVYINDKLYSDEGYVKYNISHDEIDIGIPIANVIQTIVLDQNVFTYDGKIQNPRVVSASLINGDKVKAGMYTVDYVDQNGQHVVPVKPGTYYVLVKGTGIYGTGRKLFTIKNASTISKKPTIRVPSAGKKAIIVRWKHFKRSTKTGKKVWKQVKMVQIQCATDKKFEHIVKTINVAKKKTNYTIKGLKRKKTYYIRVRYAGGSAVYSKWSAIKKIKTR